jgi:hypothetical protein
LAITAQLPGGTHDAYSLLADQDVSTMSNVIPSDRTTRAATIPVCPLGAGHDHELEVRLCERVIIGQRSSPEIARDQAWAARA